MFTTTTSRPSIDNPDSRPLLRFLAIALPVGAFLLALSTLVEPGEPFIFAAVLLALAVPALVLTHRETGRTGVRTLLHDTIRVPRPLWWLVPAGFLLPSVTWLAASTLGGARPLTPSLLTSYVLDLVLIALLINIWEELAWTGFVQRRATARWGPLTGSLFTALAFTAIHVPLAFDGATDGVQVAYNLVLVLCAAVGLRLLIAKFDAWSGRSLLVIGILHSSFNATQSVVDPTYDWVRVGTLVTLGVAFVAFARRPRDTRAAR